MVIAKAMEATFKKMQGENTKFTRAYSLDDSHIIDFIQDSNNVKLYNELRTMYKKLYKMENDENLPRELNNPYFYRNMIIRIAEDGIKDAAELNRQNNNQKEVES